MLSHRGQEIERIEDLVVATRARTQIHLLAKLREPNTLANYGMVNRFDKPYAPFIQKVRRANAKVYTWRLAGPKKPDEILITCPWDFVWEPVNTFFVQRTGNVINNEYIRAFLREPAAGDDCQDQIFSLDFPTRVRFTAWVYEVEKGGKLEFFIDGKKKKEYLLPAGKGRGKVSYAMPEGWHTIYDRPLGIDIPAAEHQVTVRNRGKGWIWLNDYRIGM
jgi:hypothetical protein